MHAIIDMLYTHKRIDMFYAHKQIVKYILQKEEHFWSSTAPDQSEGSMFILATVFNINVTYCFVRGSPVTLESHLDGHEGESTVLAES